MLCPPSPGAIHWEEEMQRENKNVLWKSCIFAKLEPSPLVGACGLPGPFLSALPHCAPFPSGLPSGAVVENPPANDQWRRRKRLRFDPWVGKIPWRRKRQSTPAFLPGEFHGQMRLVGYSPWGHKELDTIEHTHTHTHTHICPISTLWSFHLLKSHGWLAPASVVSYLGKCRHCNEFLRSCRMDPHQWLKLFSYFLYYHSVRKRQKQTNQRHFQVCFPLHSWSTWLTSS